MRSAEAVAGMLCPVCKTSLAMSDRQGIEIDYCPSCRGIWLDRGELDKIIERSAASEAAARPATPPPPAPQPGYAPQPPVQGSPWGSARYDDDDDDRRRYGHGYDPRYKHKRRKSFLEDLFD